MINIIPIIQNNWKPITHRLSSGNATESPTNIVDERTLRNIALIARLESQIEDDSPIAVKFRTPRVVLGVHYNTIYQYLKRLRVGKDDSATEDISDVAQEVCRKPKYDLVKAKELLIEGQNCRQVADSFNVPTWTIRSLVNRLRDKGEIGFLRKGRPIRNIDTVEVAELLKTKSVIEVANEIGVHRNLIYHRINNTKDQSAIIIPPDSYVRRLYHRTHPQHRSKLAPMAEYYPFVTQQAENSELVLAVNSLVPKYLTDDIRADVCQDMIVAVLLGECTLDDLQGSASEWVKRLAKNYRSKWGSVSIDAPIRQGDSRTIAETLIG